MQNWQQPKVGELDLVMIESGQAWSTLVFIEVRQRQRSCFGDAALSVTAGKQRKIIKTAKYFLQQYSEYGHYDCRFDVIAYDVVRRTSSVNNVKNNNGKNDKVKYYSLNKLNAAYQQYQEIESQEMKSHQTNNCAINNSAVNSQPEWLIGAFIATAW